MKDFENRCEIPRWESNPQCLLARPLLYHATKSLGLSWQRLSRGAPYREGWNCLVLLLISVIIMSNRILTYNISWSIHSSIYLYIYPSHTYTVQWLSSSSAVNQSFRLMKALEQLHCVQDLVMLYYHRISLSS